MSNYKNTIIGFNFFIIVGVLFLHSITLANDIEVKINLNKQEYIESEAVVVSVFIYNNTGGDIEINELDISKKEFQFIVRDTQNIVHPFRGVRNLCEESALKSKISSGAYLYRRFDNMVYNYGEGKSMFNCTKRFIHRGKYSIKAILRYNNDIIESNEVFLQILEPKGQETDARYLLGEALEEFGKTNFHNAVQLFDSLRLLYPNSVFRPRAYYELINIHGMYLRDRKRASHYSKMLLDEYSQTEFAIQGFSQLCSYSNEGVDGMNSKKNIIDYVLKNFHGTKVESYVKNLLEKRRE